ncbi:MAG: DUF968 domain-containing protein [Devosia sp.]|nr:DUF968 domain-containing protein [Devosia sp.]
MIPGRQRKPRRHDEKHLRFIRQLPCLLTGRSPVEACHIRYADLEKGKQHTGKGERPDDEYVVPLHPDLHREQHSMNERSFWQKQGVDPVKVAKLLYAVSGNFEEAAKVLRLARLNRRFQNV